MSSNNNSSVFAFNSLPPTEFCENNFNFFESLTESDNYIKLEPKSHCSSNDDQDINSANIFNITSMPFTPPDDSEELLQIYPNKLPIRFAPSPPLEVSISNSSSSLSLPLDINATNFFKNENVNSTNNVFNIDCEQAIQEISSIQNGNVSNLQQTFEYQKSYNHSFECQEQPQQVMQQKIQYQPQQTHFFQNESQQYQHHFYNISTCSNNISNINLTVNQNNFVTSSLSSKQDVSVGTDLSIIKDLRCKYLIECLLLAMLTFRNMIEIMIPPVSFVY